MRETGAKRFRCGEEWRRWLHENHSKENEAWVVIQKALKESPEAHRNFMGFPNSRFMYIHWINDAKRAETRARRIKRVVERATQNKKPGIDM